MVRKIRDWKEEIKELLAIIVAELIYHYNLIIDR